jgi:hypothetical protein
MREKLRSEIQEVEWSALRDQLARDALVTVSPELDLAEVGECVARDDKSLVSEWIEKALVSKPTLAQLDAWEKQPGMRFRFLIVSPFVLIQSLSH